MTGGGLTILRTLGGLQATKRWTWHAATQCWLKKSYDKAAQFNVGEVTEMTEIDDLAEAIRQIAADPRAMIIRGALTEAARAKVLAYPATLVRRRKYARGGVEPDFIEVPRQWFMVDVDNFQLRAMDDLIDDPEGAAAYAISEILPACFQDVRCFWQLSSSAGFEHGVLKVHLFYWLTEPLIDGVLKWTLRQHAPGITDLSVYQGVQPHYVAGPIIEGGPDPIPRRFGWIEGVEDAVALPALSAEEPRPRAAGGTNSGGRGDGDPLGRLGDGEGLDGYHLPLRTAAVRYARRCTRTGDRDDAAFIATCRAAIEAAPRRSGRKLSDYLDGDYLARSIAGAFAWLAGLDESSGVAPEPKARPVRLPLAEARRALGEAVTGFFAAAETHDRAVRAALEPATVDMWNEASGEVRTFKIDRDAARMLDKVARSAAWDAAVAWDGIDMARQAMIAARADFHAAERAVAEMPKESRAHARAERERRRAIWHSAREAQAHAREDAATARAVCQAAVDAGREARRQVEWHGDAARLKTEARKIGADIRNRAATRASDAAGPYPVHAIMADVGLGKSTETRRRAATRLHEMRAAGDDREIVFLVPTAKLGHEQVERFTALPEAVGLVARVRLGREQPDPQAPGETMCRDLDAVVDAQEAMMPVFSSACRQRDPTTGQVAHQCRYFGVCGTQRQRRQRADVWFLAHEHVYLAKATEVGDPALVIVDEAPWDAGLIGDEGHHIALAVDAVRRGDTKIPDAALATVRLAFMRHRLADVLDRHEDGPLTRAAMLAADFTEANAGEARGLEWRRKIEVEMWPGMPVRDRKAAAKAGAVNKRIWRLDLMWRAVGALVAPAGPTASGWAALAVAEVGEGTIRVLHLKGRREVAEGWQRPTLLIDATLQADLIRPFWPTVEVTAEIAVEMPHQHVIQVADTTYSKNQLDHAGAMDAVHAILCREARLTNGRVLVVAQLDAEAEIKNRGMLPVNVVTAHHNAIAGRDEWRDVTALIVIGRTAAPPAAVQRQAEAMTGEAIEPVQGWYATAPAAREMTDGTWRAARADRHPHAIAEAMRWHAAEGELIQIIGRARGADRTAANPVHVLMMVNTVIPIPIERLIAVEDLAPSPVDRMLAAGGVALLNSTDAATAYPDLWKNRNTAKSAIGGGRLGDSPDREYLSRESPNLTRITYQLAGAGKKLATALADMALVPDPRGWLEERLGVLTRFEVVEPETGAVEQEARRQGDPAGRGAERDAAAERQAGRCTGG